MGKKIYTIGHAATSPVEKGAASAFGSVRLGDEAPTGDVTVSFASQNGYFTGPSDLTFTALNYATPQAITLTGVDDGLIEGTKEDTLTITATGGGYSTTKTMTVTITDSGLDKQFLRGYNWMYGIHINEVADLATRRNLLINGNGSTFRGVFNTAGLPTNAVPDSVDTDLAGATAIGQTTVGALVGAAGVDALTWSMLDGNGDAWTHKDYIIRNATPNGKCLMICGGHGSELYHLTMLNEMLAEGFDIAYTFMPVTFQNVEASASIGSTGVGAHNDIITSGLDSAAFMALELFYFDKIMTLNYLDANADYSDYYITGCSGGGLTAMFLAAMDTRFSKCVEIRGIKPNPFRAFTDSGLPADWDFEQGPPGPYYSRNLTNHGARVDALYQAVSVYDLLILASMNDDGTPRRIYVTHHSNDTCCHTKFTYNLWKSPLKTHIEALGGSFDLTLNSDPAYATHGFNTNDRAICITEFTA